MRYQTTGAPPIDVIALMRESDARNPLVFVSSLFGFLTIKPDYKRAELSLAMAKLIREATFPKGVVRCSEVDAAPAKAVNKNQLEGA